MLAYPKYRLSISQAQQVSGHFYLELFNQNWTVATKMTADPEDHPKVFKSIQFLNLLTTVYQLLLVLFSLTEIKISSFGVFHYCQRVL